MTNNADSPANSQHAQAAQDTFVRDAARVYSAYYDGKMTWSDLQGFYASGGGAVSPPISGGPGR